MSKTSDFSLNINHLLLKLHDAAQEFFKKDCFADKCRCRTDRNKEGYSKARLVITETHLNAGNRTQGGALFHWPTSPWQRQPILTAHWLSHCLPISLSCVAADRATYYMPKPANGTSDVLPDIIRLTSPTRTGKLVATFESSVFRKGDALPFTL